jgi:hypothetical protein
MIIIIKSMTMIQSEVMVFFKSCESLLPRFIHAIINVKSFEDGTIQ